MVLMYVLTYFVFDPIVKVVEGSTENKQSSGDIDEEVTEQQQQPPPDGQTISQDDDEWKQDNAFAQKVCPRQHKSCMDDTECRFYWANPKTLNPTTMNKNPKKLFDDLIQCLKETEVETLSGVLSKNSGYCEGGQLKINLSNEDNTEVSCITEDRDVQEIYTCSEGWAHDTRYTCAKPWEKREIAA